MAEKKTTTTQNKNVLGAVAYLLGFVTGIILLLVEKDNKFIRFHAMQSTIVFGGLFIANIVLGSIPLLNILTGLVLFLVSVVLWILLMVKAYQGELYKLPYIGNIAEEQLAKMK